MEGKISNSNSENVSPTTSDNSKDQLKSGASETKSTTVTEHENNTTDNETIFQKSVKKLLHVRQLGKSPSETFDLYMNQLNGLYSDHIDSLVREKSDLNTELQNIQKKQKENHNMTIARVDTLLNVLRSWADMDKFSEKSMKRAIQEKIKSYTNFKKILIQLSERSMNSVHCPIYKGDSITRRVETNQLRRELKEKDDEIEELKNKLESIVKNMHCERKSNCEILSVFKCCDDDCFLRYLIQTTVGVELLQKEVNAELKEIRETILNDKQFVKDMFADDEDCPSEDSKKETSAKQSTTKEESNFLKQQLEVLHDKLKAFHTDFLFQASTIRRAFNKLQENKAEAMSNAKTRLTAGGKDLDSYNSDQIKAMLQESEAEVKMLQEELSCTLQEMSSLQMDCYVKNGTIAELEMKEKRAIEECSKIRERMTALENHQVELKKEVDETRGVLEKCDRLFKQKVHDEQLTTKKLKENEKKIKTLQSQLAGTQHELTIVSKENSRLKNFQQRTMK